MDLSIKAMTDVLHTTADQIKQATDNPAQAMGYIQDITDNFGQISTNLTTLPDVKTLSNNEINAALKAIQKFLTNSKEAQERVGAVAAAIIGPQFMAQMNQINSGLERFKAALEEKKSQVTETEKGEGG